MIQAIMQQYSSQFEFLNWFLSLASIPLLLSQRLIFFVNGYNLIVFAQTR